MNLSFAGCGFLGVYHVGVGVCIQKFAPHLLLDKISGASAGALAACCLLCNVPLCSLTSDILSVALEARKHRLGAFNPNFKITHLIKKELEKSLPMDAHITVTGKLHVSLTRMPDGENVIISEYKTRDFLIKVLMATSFIPFFSGAVPPDLDGVKFVDGCFSDNLPELDEHTITVSPFCGESDICPRDDSSQLLHLNLANTSVEISKKNVYRMMRILFPPRADVLANICWQGFDDALRFMEKNNIIKCEDCAKTAPRIIQQLREQKDDCEACRRHQEEARYSKMPESVVRIFEKAIENTNKGFYNWIFKFRGMKIISFLALPCLFPIDVLYAIVTRLITNSPNLGTSMWEATTFILEIIKQICQSWTSRKRSSDIYQIVMSDIA